MQVSLDDLAKEQLSVARGTSAKRAAKTVLGGPDRLLRQTLIALVAGAMLAEHQNPGEATVYVISGQVELRAGDQSWLAGAGDLVEIPPGRHSLIARSDAVILLTTVPRARPSSRD